MVRDWLGERLFPRDAPRTGSARSLAIFAAKYLVGIGAGAFFLLGGFARRRHRMLLNDILAHFGFGPRPIHAELPTIPISDVVSADTPVVLLDPVGRDGNVSLLELLILARLVAARQPDAVFEIGTFDGRTTLNLAANTRGHVFTLDLPAAQVDATHLPLHRGDASYISKAASGERFAGRREAERITQVFGDSATLDFSPWQGRIDFVFIDGAHSRDYVLSDTQRALRLLRPAGGVIVWHDYDSWDGVTLALHEIARGGLPLQRIAETSLAILTVGEARP
jgi:hypothetical protein